MNGTWKLYVMDTSASYRGVIEAGWAIQYGTKVAPLLTGLGVSVPAGSPAQAGAASQYPIAIDLSHVDASLPVRRLALSSVSIKHTLQEIYHPAGIAAGTK